jgi:hypothetical protein
MPLGGPFIVVNTFTVNNSVDLVIYDQLQRYLLGSTKQEYRRAVMCHRASVRCPR